MRHSLARFLLVLSALLVLAAAWSKEDHEIFRLRDEVQQTEGLNVTFYDFLGVTPSVSQADLLKAFRQKSKQLHPDKAKRAFVTAYRAKNPSKPGAQRAKGPSDREIAHAVKLATERYARLGVVYNILKGADRERYDHFLRNGFPKWKGTGYYYSRLRPGLGSVLFGLFVAFGGGAHYGALVLSWKRQRDFVDRYIRHARRAAWGDELGIKGLSGLGESNGGNNSGAGSGSGSGADNIEGAVALNRRQKRMMDKENRKDGKKGARGKSSGTATPSERKRVIAENGKILIVDVRQCVLEEENEDGVRGEFLLDVEEIPRPTVLDTFAVKLPLWVYRKTVGRFVGAGEGHSVGSVGEVAAGEAVGTDVDVVVGHKKRYNNAGSRKKGKRS
ncbi:hypothetical protein ACJ72_02504 [Emergomyces africanus]|uniref:J domain-containing protein n=1 Tax=Emergomyces africanus TaxID=1955775 RepID=A0A1B7P297_9EURO|nr:hypothetical protein ACJ72_02504 [Emergomyces africanus]